jgi:Domain of unknown function (DUF4249)
MGAKRDLQFQILTHLHIIKDFKYMNKLFLIGSLAFTLVSCEKEIDLDLNTSDPKFVVEATLNDQSDTASVQITRTVNFTETNAFPAVTDATVVITDNEGAFWNCIQTAPGIYQNTNLRGKVGRTYTLRITTGDGQEFVAQSTMPDPVRLDSVSIRESTFGPPGGGGDSVTYVLIPRFFDPAAIQNNYRFIQTVNGKRDLSIVVGNDNIFNGRINERPLFGFEEEINAGDEVTIEMLCIDRGVYDYFYSLSSGGGGPNSAAVPANPVSNISNGALGYFSAFSLQNITIRIP